MRLGRRLFDLGASSALGAAAVGLAVAEAIWPLRARTMPRGDRWRTNAAIAVSAGLVERLIVITAMTCAARMARRQRFGILRWLPFGPVLGPVLGLLALDYAIYRWHRANHRFPVLWRFHRAHHADPDLDITTALRFHPGEILLSTLVRCLAVAAFGGSPALALTHELLMQLATCFHHSNLRLPRALDVAAVHVFVTPRMHGVHHSILPEQRDANWSVIFSFWDRLHGSLRLDGEQPARLGDAETAPRDATNLGFTLTQPFRR